jgi:hypothetical protein
MNIAVATPQPATARYSGAHKLISMSVPPSVQYLFQWLLQQKNAGREQEIDLEAYQAFTANAPITQKSCSALDALIEVGLVALVRQYNAHFWQIIAYHPGQQESLTNAIKTSQDETNL